MIVRLGRSAAVVMTALAVGAILFSQNYAPAPDAGKPGGPIEGLSPLQLKRFRETEVVYKKEFTPEEGLGPLFNGRSCFECHGQPGAVGGEGRDVAGTGVVRIGAFRPECPKKNQPLRQIITQLGETDVHGFLADGGPALERKSITSEFPNKYPFDCQVEFGTIPKSAQFVSMRHAGPLFGFGLIDAILDDDIIKNALMEVSLNPKMAGRPAPHVDGLTNRVLIGRFGWKAQNPNLLTFTGEALDAEMGITTPLFRHPKSAKGLSVFPPCILATMPPEPNDNGKIQAQLTYFQSLLAPPARGVITPQAQRGEVLFKKLQCAYCHKPEMSSAPEVFVVDPDSPAPRLNYLEVAALENKPVPAYSDFLLHDMGPDLADGLPQAGARGGEWRTTPLWGLRLKKFFLHDGRTRDLAEAVLAHGGQGQDSAAAFKKLPDNEKQDLLAFLRSL